MLVSVEKVEVNEAKDVILTCSNIESVILAEDWIDEQFETKKVKFVFPTGDGIGARKYLLKIIGNAGNGTFRDRINGLQGKILSISENFIEK